MNYKLESLWVFVQLLCRDLPLNIIYTINVYTGKVKNLNNCL